MFCHFMVAWAAYGCQVILCMPQVQILVEKDKKVNFKHVLELAASVQPMKVEANTLEDVRIKCSHSSWVAPNIVFPFTGCKLSSEIVLDTIYCSVVSRCINLLHEDWNSFWFVQLSWCLSFFFLVLLDTSSMALKTKDLSVQFLKQRSILFTGWQRSTPWSG